MDLGLNGKRAVVTGGTRGIGRAITETLAREGCDVGICARSEDAVKQTVASLEALGVRCTGSAIDVAQGEGLRSWIESAANTLGGIDILVPNVSAMDIGAGPESWKRGFELDILGTVNTVEAALPFLKKSGTGAITVVCTTAAVQVEGPQAYAGVKAALIPYIKGLAVQLAPENIRANLVSPGTIYFEGGVWQKIQKHAPEMYNNALQRNPMGRMGTPQEVANAVVFLSSPASSFISGTNLICDGALTRRVQY
jgi:3-oxoacyl-[acyl-carrier protein] reductase